MKVLILLMIVASASMGLAQDYSIDWYVIGSGGGESQSTNYRINGTIGQPIVGISSSANYTVESGFWVGSGIMELGYEYLPGDANMYNGSWPPAVIGSDVTYLVNYFRGMTTNPACLIDGNYMAADVNASCTVIGSDVTRLVNYFRGSGAVEYCPDWEPAWLTAGDLPPLAPSGWPNCESPAIASDSKIIDSQSK